MDKENGLHVGFMGSRVEHVSHGIQGDVVAIHTTIGGETTLCVEHVTKGGSVEREWFNVTQVKVVPRKTAKKATKASDRRTVKKHSPRIGR